MVEALSGGRWQGSSTAEATATVTDPLTSDLGWVSNGTGNGYNASDYIDFKMVSPDASSGSDRDTVYIDLQDSDYLDGSNLATNFVVRCIVNFSDLNLASVNENRAYLGFYDTDAWGGTSQDMFALQIGCWTDSGAIRRLWTQGIDGGTFEGGSETKSQFTLVPAVDTDYYITWTKDGDTLKVRITTNSDYSGGEEQTVSKSGLAGLRYFGWKGRGDTQNNGGNTQGTIKPDIKIWNNATSPTSDEKDSLTNVPANSRYEETDTRKIYRFGGINTSGLKALYNFDSSWSNNATDSDSITTGGDMTAQNNATFSTSVKKLGTASASFPADGDYAKTSTANGANFDFTGDSTVTLWVYRTDGLDSSYHAMVSKRSGGNSEYNLYLEPVSSGVSKPHLYITMGSSTFNGASDDPIPDSTWTHLATTIDGDVMKYYINGALDSTHDLNGAKGTLANQPFGVGAISGTGTEGYQGYLDQVSVWNRALSASEISTIYNSGTGKNIAGWTERNTA